MRNALRWAALAFTGLVVAGCGGSGSDDAAPAGEEPTASSAPAAEEEVPATVDTGAATLRATLTGLLQEHVYLAGAVTDATLNGSPEGATAASATLDRNSQALANAFGNVYGPEAGDAFLEGWRGHIANFADYAAGRGTGDTARAGAARDALDRYAADFGANVSSASEGRLPADALAEELGTHVDLLTAAIDAQADADPAAVGALREAARHMRGTAETLAGGIVAQFPDRFDGEVGDEASDLRTDLTALFQEHAYLAGAALGETAAGRTDTAAAASQALEANATDLADAFVRDLPSSEAPAARTELLDGLRGLNGLYPQYLAARQADDDEAARAARNALNDLVLDDRDTTTEPDDDQGLAVLLERVTDTDLPRADVATELSALPSGVLSAIDALTSEDPEGPEPVDQVKSAADTAYRLGTVVSGGIVSSHNDAFRA